MIRVCTNAVQQFGFLESVMKRPLYGPIGELLSGHRTKDGPMQTIQERLKQILQRIQVFASSCRKLDSFFSSSVIIKLMCQVVDAREDGN